MIDFVGPAARRTSGGLARAADLIGCEVAALQADIQVEAASSGYDVARRPKALFEPHVFYRHLFGAAREGAILRGLAYPKWGTHPYPRDSYPQIAQAMRIDPEAALMATSWGLPQILGENHGAAGYASAAAMVEAFVAGGEDEHLAAMARFIVAEPRMRSALCAQDWATFARLYNGPATRGYDTKLAAAYQRALTIHPADINAHIAAKDARAANHARLSSGALGGLVLVSVAPAIHVASHGHAGLVIGLVVAATAIGIVFTLRTIAFGHKAAVFAAASKLSPSVTVPAAAPPTAAISVDFK